MAVKISFLKKIKLFKEYKKAIKSYSIDLESKYGIRIDRAYRLYTVLNIPEEFIGELFLNKSYKLIYNIKNNYIDTSVIEDHQFPYKFNETDNIKIDKLPSKFFT